MSDEYYRDYAEAYDATSAGVAGDIEFYRDLAVASGGPIVELGVGTGRIAIPIAEAGVDVIGIDLDRLTLIEGDMRDFTVASPVPLVTIPYRAFLHNLETADQLATLEACHRALRPGGRLALNVFNPEIRAIAGGSGLAPEEWAPRGARSRSERPRSGAGQQDGASEHVVRSKVRVQDADGRWREARLALRYVSRAEMAQLFARAGFVVESLTGDFSGQRFRRASTEMVWVVRKDASPSDDRVNPG